MDASMSPKTHPEAQDPHDALHDAVWGEGRLRLRPDWLSEDHTAGVDA